MRAWLAAIFVAANCWAQPPDPNAATIMERSRQASERDWLALPEFNYSERDLLPGGTRTYHDLMIFGSPEQVLVEIDGKPLTAAKQAAEQARLVRIVAQRKMESPSDRARRMAKYRRDRERNHQLLSQLLQAFDFKLVGRQTLGPRPVFVLAATPRAGYIPPNLACRVLTGMQGRLWIDTETFQWAKVEAEVIRPVSIDGFLARVDPGTRFELEYTPVTGDVWLPSHFAMKARAKILYLFSHRDQADESYFDYQKAAPQANR